MLRSDAQSDTENTPNVTGVWVGIIDWHESSEMSGDDVGTVYVYRMRIAQTEDNLLATHFTDGEDLLLTRPVDLFDEPLEYGFEGSQDGDSVTFENVPVFMGHCQISIHLHYAVVDGSSILIGEWQPYFPPVPTPIHTPQPDAVVADAAIGCGIPDGGSIMLRRFEEL